MKKRIYYLLSKVLILSIFVCTANNTYAQKKSLTKNKDVLDSLKSRIHSEPNNQYLYKAIGDIYASNGSNEEALVYLDKSIKADNLYFKAYYSRGYILNEIGKYKESVEDYEFILNKLTDDNPLIANEKFFLNLGVAYMNLKEFGKALISFEKCIKINNHYQVAYYNKGNALIKLEKYDDAILAFDESIKIDSNDASSYFNRAYAKYKLGDFLNAIGDYNIAFNYDSSFYDSFKWIGMCYVEIGDIDAACEHWNTAKKSGIDVDDLIKENCAR